MIYENEKEIAIPASWIWDIIDEFIYQFQVSCRQRTAAPDNDKHLNEFIKDGKKNLDDI